MERYSPLEDARQIMQRIIDGREAAITREYERSANPWIPCFISVGFQLETYLRELGQEN